MPKSTFHNLPDEKKGRIFDAALQEFSARKFSEASINQIIKTAGIPKGSFYQYFESKEDIYLYMVEVIRQDKMEVLEHEEELDPDADVFAVILHTTKGYFEEGKVRPGYLEAGIRMELDNGDIHAKAGRSSTEKFIQMVQRDQARGLIRQDVDPELVIALISAYSLREYHRYPSDKERYLKNLGAVIEIIRKGVAAPGEGQT